MRMPTASKIAFAIAGATGISALSPMPLAPKGPVGSGTSRRIVSIVGRHVAEGRQNVIDEIWIDQLPIVIGDFFKHRLTDAGNRGAGELLPATERVERLADIDRGRIFESA